ncbi:UPF0179 family protein [uncultured Methanobrevibacter sp.]|uniref:UPF0179 family protein n=1 Tax=uncultured Methanobrevibacter sp. TaxID=253161 RepID=UPI0025DF9959|nr:UPF0179 family protein [uncultured Methanobrevibacter sp.]
MITLIGKELAKEGVSFVFHEPMEECTNCRFKASCIDSLEEGHRYVITEVRDVEQKCPIHEGEKVNVVVVEDAEFTILTDKKGVFEGSTFDFGRNGCSNKDCDYRHMCFPEGISKDEKGIYVKDLGKFKDCPREKSLQKCIVKIYDK